MVTLRRLNTGYRPDGQYRPGGGDAAGKRFLTEFRGWRFDSGTSSTAVAIQGVTHATIEPQATLVCL
jgi:hypothetical protein